ncbi:hypothetical protein EV651_1375 [Kribbella sp. VKM Ac-2571]|nr:hypothetical protein EV651_1375 [Kribbella sp. VKM Ac-2571]
MLMVLGFVGTLIALERAVAYRQPVALVAPALLGLSVMLLLSPVPVVVGKGLLVAGAAALVVLYVPLWRRQRDTAVLVQALGAVLALGAAGLWLGGVTIPMLLPWLVGFVVLTICGERVELARLSLGSRVGGTTLLLACALLGGVVAALLWPTSGTALLSLALLTLTWWLAGHDVARHTIRSSGLPRYTAICMLAAYGWLGVASAIWLVGGPAGDGARYDAVVHAVFLGFTLSMIMAHAPVILPAVLRRPLPYRPVLLGPVALLHASIAVRLWLGDGLGSHIAWVTGGVLNVAAVVLFVAVAIWSTTRRAKVGVAQ